MHLRLSAETIFFKIVCSINTQRRHYKEFDPMLFHRLCGIWRKSFIIKSYVEVESYFIWASRPDLWIMIDERAFVENLLCSQARDFLNIFVRDVLTHPIVIYHIRWFYFYLTFLSSGVPGYYFYRKNCTFEHVVIMKLMYYKNRKDSRGVGWLASSCSFLLPIFLQVIFLLATCNLAFYTQ